jgi:hypothetical protein
VCSSSNDSQAVSSSSHDARLGNVSTVDVHKVLLLTDCMLQVHSYVPYRVLTTVYSTGVWCEMLSTGYSVIELQQ